MMKTNILITALTLCLPSLGDAYAPESLETLLSDELTIKQDELSAEVQELIEIQTQEKLIQKLETMEGSMIDATLKLLQNDTGGETIAIQTKIIENAYEAAKQKQKSRGEASGTNKALMDMLDKMMGKETPTSKKGSAEKPSPENGSGGNGQEGSGAPSLSENTQELKFTLPTGSTRTVPSIAPTSGQLLPAEFQSLVDDYNN